MGFFDYGFWYTTTRVIGSEGNRITRLFEVPSRNVVNGVSKLSKTEKSV